MNENGKHQRLIEDVRRLFVNGEISPCNVFYRLERALSGAEIEALIAQWEPDRVLYRGVDLLEHALDVWEALPGGQYYNLGVALAIIDGRQKADR